ncbi:MAG TPA: glycosyltransferase [Kocuria rosea]|nr:glycosyltransferase [Kocuria rosea]
MRAAVLTELDGAPRDVVAEAELRAVLEQLAARGVEAVGEPADEPAGEPSGEPGEKPLAEGVRTTAGEPAPPAGSGAAEAVLIVGGGADEPLAGAPLTRWADAAGAAARAGRPVVVTGLALDAGCAGARAERVRELLGAASFVGLRDPASLAVARRLCPDHPALHVGGDATALLAVPGPAPEPAPDPARAPEGAGRPRIVVALTPAAGPFTPDEAAPVLTALLDALVHRTGGTVELLPGAAGPPGPDPAFHDRVAAQLTAPRRGPGEERAAGTADEVVARTASADYVVTTRPRAAALAAAGGAAVLPVPTSAYAEQRMQGALSGWGLVEHAVPLAALLTPGDAAWDTRAAAQQWAEETVGRREAVRSALAAAAPARRAAAAQWWDAVARALRSGAPGDVPAPGAAPRGVGAPVARALRRRYTVPEAAGARPTVAVVLRTHDRPVLLRRALDDVLGQTFTDWRLVVVGDGGDAGAVAALVEERREALAGRVTVLHHRRPLGAWAAANRGLRAADSELVVLHDDDDQWHPTFLQRAVSHLENPLVSDDGVLVRTEVVHEQVEQDRIRELDRELLWPGRRDVTLADLLRGDATAPSSFLYRRAVHGVLGDYDESLTGAGEWEFLLRFLETFTAGLLDGRPLALRGALPDEPPARAEARRREDLLVRERHLRQWTSENGIGLPLYLSREAQDQAGRLHRRLDDSELLVRELLALAREQAERIDRLERTVAEKGFVAFLRRTWRALVGP